MFAVTEEDSDALEKLLLDKKIKGFSLTGEKTYETVVQHLRELGHEELAANFRLKLNKGGYIYGPGCVLEKNVRSINRSPEMFWTSN